jgi:methyltransferase (TIGR00027 family)
MKPDAASATALLVARGVAFHSTHPRYGALVPPEAGELSRRFVGPAKSGSSAFDRFVVALQERLTVPGISLHYVLRKRAIEDLVRNAIADGFQQLVVLGAGLDTLAIRLGKQVRAIEIDHPSTQRLKSGSDVEYLAVDFTRERLSDALARSKQFDSDARTIFVAEAVFLYLTDTEVRSVLEQIRAKSPRARVIFTFWAPRVGRAINFQNATWIADLYLRMKREPGKWAIAPDDVRRFVESCGYKLREIQLDADYQRHYLPNPPALARGEHIAVCG